MMRIFREVFRSSLMGIEVSAVVPWPWDIYSGKQSGRQWSRTGQILGEPYYQPKFYSTILLSPEPAGSTKFPPMKHPVAESSLGQGPTFDQVLAQSHQSYKYFTPTLAGDATVINDKFL